MVDHSAIEGLVEDEPSDVPVPVAKSDRTKKIVVAVIMVILIGGVIIDSFTKQFVKNGIDEFLEWIEENAITGVFAFAGVYFVATVLFIPGSILTLGSGFVFGNAFGLGYGVLLGAASVFFGASLGAIAAFLIGRFLLRDWVKVLTEKYSVFEAIDAALEDKGFRINALLRLSPIIPFNALNYIMGVTAVSLTAYASSLLFILPGTVLYVFLGASAGSLSESENQGDDPTITIIIIVVGIVFGVLAIGATSYYAKKELAKVTERKMKVTVNPANGDVESPEESPENATEGIGIVVEQ